MTTPSARLPWWRSHLAQRPAGSPAVAPEPRLEPAPLGELVNTLEFGAEAERLLGADAFHAIAGSDRAAFDRMTFRPRMMVNCLNLDLGIDLFGVRLFAPILVGPAAHQRRFHPDAELATVRGAEAAKSATIVSARSSTPFETLVKATSMPVFAQVFAEDGVAAARGAAESAAGAGARGIVVTVGGTDTSPRRLARLDWPVVEGVANAVAVPVIAKGIVSAGACGQALVAGARGLIVSTYGRDEAPGRAAPLDLIAAIVDASTGVPVLVDGGFRRGTDIVKALALGARAVLVTRPVLWGVAAYGATGAQAVLEMLQTELARVMACCGAPTLSAIRRDMVAVHAATPATRSSGAASRSPARR